LEARVEALIEGTFARWFAERLHPKDVAVQLARALEDSTSSTMRTPATRYTVRLHPDDADALLAHYPDLSARLSAELVTIARDIGLTLNERPQVTILRDATIKLRSIKVEAELKPALDETTTQSLTPVTPPAPDAQTTPASLSRAFLILDGERTLPLQHAVINLGRRTDNHVILDDARVSRSHAQLRLRFGRYVIYDLGSSAGTFVNDQRVQECILRPGDVISLGGVAIIYGEDDARDDSKSKPPRSGAEGQTVPLTR
jgi:pSer/pThr/pTyr-binding forkhead associated (FHA) protein